MSSDMTEVLDNETLTDTGGDTGLPRAEDGVLVEEEASPHIDTSDDGSHDVPLEQYAAHEEKSHPPIRQYLVVAAVLAALTALETSTYWIDFGRAATPLLLVLMVLKFTLVIMYFMHLKFDSKLFGAMFYIGLGLTLMVYFGVFFSYRMFWGH